MTDTTVSIGEHARLRHHSSATYIRDVGKVTEPGSVCRGAFVARHRPECMCVCIDLSCFYVSAYNIVMSTGLLAAGHSILQFRGFGSADFWSNDLQQHCDVSQLRYVTSYHKYCDVMYTLICQQFRGFGPRLSTLAALRTAVAIGALTLLLTHHVSHL